MSTHSWSIDPMQLVAEYEKKDSTKSRGNSGALIIWAVWAVDSLYYLEDVADADRSGPDRNGPHQPSTKDVAHIRWATGTAISALDLCAAAVAREVGLQEGDYEFDLRGLSKRQEELPAGVTAWIQNVEADPRYPIVLNARKPLTHSRVLRHFSNTGPMQVELTVPGVRIGAEELIRQSKTLATEHVEKFLSVVQTL